MKLLRKKDSQSNFVIYGLNEEEAQLVESKFGKKAFFYVAGGEFCDFYLKDHSFKDIIKDWKNITPAYYLGFFQTYLEAYYHIKLIEATSMIDHMEWKMKEALDIENYDKENQRMITENSDKLDIKFYPLTEEKPNMKDHPEFEN